MARQFLPLVLLTVLLVPASAEPGQGPPAQQNPALQSERVRQGVSHFERAFYELTPQKRDREAALEFDQAIAQFELEISRQPSSAVAHQYLGRIYSLRKDYRKSAEHYDRLSEIEPLTWTRACWRRWLWVKPATSPKPSCGCSRRGSGRRTRRRSRASPSTSRKRTS